jgi:hypothetical protein
MRRAQSKPLEGKDTTSGLLATNKIESSLIALSHPAAVPASKKDHYEARRRQMNTLLLKKVIRKNNF